jgi:hypothetical protein
VQSKEQKKCIKLMNRASVNVGKVQGSESSKCVKFAARDAIDKLGTPPQIQTAQECLTNDVTGKVQRKFGTLAKRDATKCLAEPQQLPDFGYVGALGAGSATLAESLALTEELFGSDLDAALVLKDQDKEGAKCQEVAHRSAHKVFDAVTKEVQKSVYDSLKGKTLPQADSASSLSLAARNAIEVDHKSKIARAEWKVADKIERACLGDLASLFPGTCSDGAGTALDLAQCLNEAARCRGCKAAEGFGALTLGCEEFDNGLADSSCQ